MTRILIIIALIVGTSLSAQVYPKDWHLKFSTQDTTLGIDLENAIKNNPKPANAKTVIVAVIDDGIDIQHEDLKNNIYEFEW
jgi:subtilisin family serine protease